MNLKSEISKKLSDKINSGEKIFFIIDFDCNNIFIYNFEDAAKENIFFDFNGITNFSPSLEKYYQKKIFTYYPVSFSDYYKGFKICMDALQKGDTYLVNLTCRTPISTEYSLNEIFELSKAPFRLLFKDKFVVFSPERFVRIIDNIIETRPMKGTIDANIPNAENIILNSTKELYEHNTIVDLLRNDLNIVANNVFVEKFRYIDRINSIFGDILQVSSIIKGTIKPIYFSNYGELLLNLLPAGSVTGAPKKRTVEIIKQAENYDRGFYTGIFGIFDGKVLDTAVAIRFIENIDGNLYFKSGGGITALSNPYNEYNEILKKIYVPIV